MKEPNVAYLKAEIERHLNEGNTMLSLLKYFAERKRSAPVSDLSHILTNMRRLHNSDFSKNDVLSCLMIFQSGGLCLIRGAEGREKIHWDYWPFPVLSPDQSKILGLEFKEMKALLSKKTMFRQIKHQLEVYGANLASSTPDTSKVPDVVFNINRTEDPEKANLSDISTEEILIELERRGLKLSLLAK